MLKIISMFVMLMSVACVPTDVESVREDSIGKFYLGLSEAKVKKNVKCSVKLGKNEFWGADGLYHQRWEYVDCGLVFDMTSAEQNATKVIASIRVVRPSILTTEKGIGIGSSEKEVMTAYDSRWNTEESREDRLVIDSIFGGILFSIKDGKVSAVFVGESSE